MVETRWQVRFTLDELPVPVVPLPFVEQASSGWDEWRAVSDVPVGTPFLVSPDFRYDVVLNGYFTSALMVGAAPKTREAHARDVAAFLSFLGSARSGRGWRDADESDHLAYLHWRRRDPAGPRVAGSTWDREVATVNQFYRWGVRSGHVGSNPIPQLTRRTGPREFDWSERRGLDELWPATYSHDAVRERIEWLPPVTYRAWRDVGVRGFAAEGLPRPGFRGRWSARNSTFCDLMVRTGLRLSEQAGLTVFDVDFGGELSGYQRFWLSGAVAKGRSARWIYVPRSVIAELDGYRALDRADVVARAQSSGVYERWHKPLVVEDPTVPVATIVGQGVTSRVKVADLDFELRMRTLVQRPGGLEPAALWLGEGGQPLTRSMWKAMFRDANRRCATAGLAVSCHAHLLRHTFAVVTLEQLQRGHIASLADLDPAQRGHYTRVFGDPLDWIRRRLGHRSVVTTQVYLHALGELEMETRMALVPDGWEDPRSAPAAVVGDERPPGTV
jgi:site-specific recombinase XerD